MTSQPIALAPRLRERLIQAAGYRQRGQALVLSLFVALLVILALFAMYGIGGQVIEKIRLQNTADSAAYSAAVAEARDYNFSAYTNRAMVANQVAVAQFVGLTSWFRNMSAFANKDSSNVGRNVYEIFLTFGGSPVASFYKKFLKAFGKIVGIFDEGKVGSTFMSAAVTTLDGLIAVYGETQRIYHYSTALTVAETLGAFGTVGETMNKLLGVDWFTGLKVLDGGDSIIAANDKDARLTAGSLPYLVWHYYKWFNFTERKDPNTSGADGANADRFAQVTMDSLDDFSRDRSTKPAWGFDFFYAPPLTYVDPTRFIPYNNGPLFLPVIHRGGTELKLSDTSGTAGTDGGDGSNGVDCHGNPVNTGGSTSAIKVKLYKDLADYSANACDGDAGMVSDDTKEINGLYTFKGGSWVKPSTLTNDQGSASGNTTPRATGNRGAAGSASKKTWTALDAASWSGLDILWITLPILIPIPIPLPIPFAPPWIPLSHGAAQSGKLLDQKSVLAGNNNFGVDGDDAYGKALSHWTTRVPAAMRQSKGAGKKSLDLVDGLGGLTGYMDVKDTGAENLTGPALVVEIEKPVTKMIASPGTGQLQTEYGAPTIRSLSKAQVYFARPTSDGALAWFKRTSGTATQAELGSLYSPYWQARLLPNNFLEQYISMEMHRAGM